MKKKVTITVQAEYEIEIDDRLVSEEGLKAWSDIMWEVESPDDLFEHVATMLMKGFADHSLDIIGYLGTFNQTYPQVPDTKFDEIYWDVTDCEFDEVVEDD